LGFPIKHANLNEKPIRGFGPILPIRLAVNPSEPLACYLPAEKSQKICKPNTYNLYEFSEPAHRAPDVSAASQSSKSNCVTQFRPELAETDDWQLGI